MFQNASTPPPPRSGAIRAASTMLSLPALTETRLPKLWVTNSAIRSDASAPSMPGKNSAALTGSRDPVTPLTLLPVFQLPCAVTESPFQKPILDRSNRARASHLPPYAARRSPLVSPLATPW